ncbi:MAG: DUF4838 domain-containing protein [Thermoguttaceae bacterium]|nr:DUF4838 domain-containing protein [Thermoguttaceae bacterium]
MDLPRSSINSVALSLLLATTLSVNLAVAAGPAVLAQKGSAVLPIVISAEATETQAQLAGELAGYLKRISGAKFDVVTGDGSSGIVLGTLREFPHPAWEKPLAVERGDGREAYGIQTRPGRVLVLGATDVGLDRGITRLLETIGCRWFFPHEVWHVAPKLETVTVTLDETGRPAMLARRIWYGWGMWDAKVRDDYEQWSRRNWLGDSITVSAGHSWQQIIRDEKEVFEKHPEYLALRTVKHDDTETHQRGGEKFCIANPGVAAVCKQWAIKQLQQDPSRDMVSMEPSDGDGHCECRACGQLGSVSERVFTLVNEVAEAAEEAFPGKYVGTLAYNVHTEPPSFRMRPNVFVQLTAGFTRGRYTFDELLDIWPERVDQFGVYEYLNVWAWTRDMPGAARGANTAYIRERFPLYYRKGARTMSCESGSNFGANGLGYLVASRLMWNPAADVDAVLADFYSKAFGPAAAVMKDYYERFDGGNRPLVSDHLMALAHRDLAEASRLAAGRSDVLARLGDLKLYLYYVRLMRDLKNSSREERLDALYPVLNFAYRSRHRYIVNSAAVRGRYQTYYLRDVEEPAQWQARTEDGKRLPPSWYCGDDYACDEIETLFQEGRERFQPQSFETRTFTDELAHGGFEPIAGAPLGSYSFQGKKTFALASLAGEPLAFELLTGRIAHYRDRRPTLWAVVHPAGEVVAQGELPLDGEWRPISVPVPRAGVYWLRVDDFGAGWGIRTEPGRSCTLKLEKGEDLTWLGGAGCLAFYVPNEVKTIAYYIDGGDHEVLGPHGQVVAGIARQPGNIIAVDVPDGAAGKPWAFRGLTPRVLWFYNCPNLVARSADELMVPAEAVHDRGRER